MTLSLGNFSVRSGAPSVVPLNNTIPLLPSPPLPSPLPQPLLIYAYIFKLYMSIIILFEIK
jgi:hypothetical protein